MKQKNLLLFLGFLTFCLPTFAASDTQTDMLYDKVERLEKDVMALQRRSYGSSASGAGTLAVSSNASLDGLYAQLNEQEATVRALTAKIETLEFNQKQLEEKINQMNTDIDMRFNLSEKKGTTASASAKNTSAPKADAATVQAEYDKAYNALKKGDYKTAESAFTAFIKKHPASSLAGNANYWLGETYYARKQYEQAVGIFADGFTKYKNNSKAPDNLLKLGLSMSALKRKADACTAFTSLPKEFPKAAQTLKDRAKAEAKKLSCK